MKYLLVLLLVVLAACQSAVVPEQEIIPTADIEEEIEEISEEIDNAESINEEIEAEFVESETDELDDVGAEDEAVAEVEERAIEEVTVLDNGFEPNLLVVEAGTTVRWVNERSGTRGDASFFVLGTRECKGVKSPFVKPGESWEYTFEEAIDCEYVDGIRVTQEGRIQVIE